MKVISLIGTRPQYIKEAVLQPEFIKHNIEEILIDSGQHYDYNMSEIFYNELAIKKPYLNLEIGSGTHAEVTAKTMIAFEKAVKKIEPNWIIVYGDTNTTLAGALVATKLKIRLAHVEAGVRMFPKNMPEEINRVLTDRISTLLFCSSERCVSNLKKENIEAGVHFCGDVMFDLFLKLKPKFKYEEFKRLDLRSDQFALMTLHRDYNVDCPTKLENILKQVHEFSKHFKVVFPIHPRTQNRVTEFNLEKYLKSIFVISPIDYLNLMGLVENCALVITDSGGLQKESYFSGKPAYLFMEDPAWHELVDLGINQLANKVTLIDMLSKTKLLDMPQAIYGAGNAGEKIVKILANQS